MNSENPAIYRKAYTRENSLIAFQIWEEHQSHLLKKKFDVALPPSVFDVIQGVAAVWYGQDVAQIWEHFIVVRYEQDSQFVKKTMQWYGTNLDILEQIWKTGKLENISQLERFFSLAAESWLGLSISYFLPSIDRLPKDEQTLGMQLRERAVDFLECTDHVLQNTLQGAYRNLGELIKYLTFQEAITGVQPPAHALQARKQHYIYYDSSVFTDTDIDSFARTRGIHLQQEIVSEEVKELRGQIAMKGLVKGMVRVLRNKSQIPELQRGEILVTAMTTPDYLPAMHQAAAFITDEGGITCHAAIVARELKKPCIIGTKIATQVLKDGMLVEIDADNGIVRIVEK